MHPRYSGVLFQPLCQLHCCLQPQRHTSDTHAKAAIHLEAGKAVNFLSGAVIASGSPLATHDGWLVTLQSILAERHSLMKRAFMKWLTRN